MKEYLEILNSKQLSACIDTEGPSLIVAGAGSGKTRVLTSRIAYLINDKHIDPREILAITFTNKAAKEMNDRLVAVVGQDAKLVTCKTFHSFSAFLLRREIEVLRGRKRSFQIIDDDETESLIRESMTDLGYDTKLVKPSTMANEISLIKCKIKTLDDFSDYNRQKLEATMNRYNEKLLQNNLLDFDDLLSLVIEVFKKEPSILEKYQDRYRYILVDEFQDSSNIQYELISMLGEKYQNVFIVGDEDQSIYSFRGANIENIRKFMNEFDGFHQHILDQNYRSTPEILEISNRLISHNTDRIPKNLWSDKPRSDSVVMKYFDTDRLEVQKVVETIKSGVQSGKYEYKDYAIIYRNNFLSNNYERELMLSRIPYKVYSGLSFYKRQEVKDMLGYLRMIINPNDLFSFMRVIKTPGRGIGDTTIKKISSEFELNGGNLRDAVNTVKVYQSHRDILNTFLDMIEELRTKFQEMTLNEFVFEVYERTGYKDYIAQIDDLDKRRDKGQNIEELFNSINEVETIGSIEDTISDFLQNVSLLTELDTESSDPNHVSLITMHSAKGLEFKNVFAVGLEDDIIPGQHGMMTSNKTEIEEERRILYVCLTRAMDNLYISCATSRYKYGQIGSAAPSRFLRELGIERKQDENERIIRTPRERNKRVEITGDMEVGTRVSHQIFGEGTIKGQVAGFYIIKFDSKTAPMKVIVNHPLLKKI